MIGERDGAVRTVSHAELTAIIRPRVEQILETIRGRLVAVDFARQARRRLVLTGGASQLLGLSDLAGQYLSQQVRPGQPIWLKGLEKRTAGPAFAVCAGLTEVRSKGR